MGWPFLTDFQRDVAAVETKHVRFRSPGINGVAANGTRDRRAHFRDRLLGPAVTAGLRALRATLFARAALVTGSEGTFHSILSLAPPISVLPLIRQLQHLF
jgi:hypothetical protein